MRNASALVLASSWLVVGVMLICFFLAGPGGNRVVCFGDDGHVPGWASLPCLGLPC